MLKRLYFFVLVFLVKVVAVSATEEPYVNMLRGTQLTAGSFLSVTDEKIRNTSTNTFTLSSVDNILSFEIDFYSPTFFYNTSFTCTANLTIEAYDRFDTSQKLSGWPKTIDLQVKYSKNEGERYKGIALYKFTGVHKFKVTVNSITSPELGNPLPAIFLLKGTTIVHDRKYPLLPPVAGARTIYTKESGGKLTLQWNPGEYPGAEMYDLEYTFVDKHSLIGERLRTAFNLSTNEGGPFLVPDDTLNKWYKNNNTRITLTVPSYTLNLSYDSGYVLFRVRGAQLTIPPEEVRLKTPWNYQAAENPTAVIASGVVFTDGHEQNLNWQYTATFAEEGKRKEVMSYFDGSLKSRQAVTINNSDNRSVVQESIYDNIGRPVVSLLPSPANDSSLHYFRAFNQNQSGDPFSFSDIIYSKCGATVNPVSTASGTGQYYSPQNPFTNFIHRNYIPDALGYPFAVTEHTPDNTGRIKRQGGVGPDFQLNSGHETSYFYGKPMQTELDRLFGSEAGDATHFLKNMVVDPNGQVSVSYQNASGKTIATALAGKTPTNLHALPSNNAGAVVNVTNELITPRSFAKNAAAYSLTASATFLAPVTGDYTFDYNVDVQRLDIAHGTNGSLTICNTCYYDLLITVKDGCDEVLETKRLPAGFLFDTTCAAPAALTGTFTVPVNKIGEYFVFYELKVSKAALDFYDSEHIKKNTDLKKVNHFLLDELKATDFTGCYSSCETCKEDLGEKEDFNAYFKSLYGRDTIAFTIQDSLWVNQLYDSLYASCEALQSASDCGTGPCDERLELLKADVSPTGQYALIDSTWQYFTNLDGANDSTLVYSFHNDGTNLLFNYTEIDFTDESGLPDLVKNSAGNLVPVKELTQDEFIKNWKDVWANSLVTRHPEYCYYLWCLANPGSYTFDDKLQDFDDADSAMQLGYFDSARVRYDALLDHDPFFSTSGLGASLKTRMSDSLRLFSRTLLRDGVPDRNILQFIDVTLYCNEQSNGWQSCQPPGADCRSNYQEWLLYRNLYLNLKRKFYEEARRTSNDAVFANCANCYIGKDALGMGTSGKTDCGDLDSLVHSFRQFRSEIDFTQIAGNKKITQSAKELIKAANALVEARSTYPNTVFSEDFCFDGTGLTPEAKLHAVRLYTPNGRFHTIAPLSLESNQLSGMAFPELDANAILPADFCKGSAIAEQLNDRYYAVTVNGLDSFFQVIWSVKNSSAYAFYGVSSPLAKYLPSSAPENHVFAFEFIRMNGNFPTTTDYQTARAQAAKIPLDSILHVRNLRYAFDDLPAGYNGLTDNLNFGYLKVTLDMKDGGSIDAHMRAGYEDNFYVRYKEQVNGTVFSSDCKEAFTAYFNSQKGTNYTYSQIDSLYRTTCGVMPDVCLSNLPFTDSTTCNYACPGGVYVPAGRGGVSYFVQYGKQTVPPTGIPAGYEKCQFYNIFDLQTVAGTNCRFFNVWVCVYDSACVSSCQPVQNLMTGTRTTSSISYTWTAAAGNQSFSWRVFNLNNPAVPVQSGTTTNSSITVQGLSANTEYKFELRSNCTPDSSGWMGIQCKTKLTPATITVNCSDKNGTEQGSVTLTFNFSQPTSEALTLYFGEIIQTGNGKKAIGYELFSLPNGVQPGYINNNDPSIPYKVIIPSGVTSYTTGLIWQRDYVPQPYDNSWLCHRTLWPMTDMYLKIHSPANYRYDFNLIPVPGNNTVLHNLSASDAGNACTTTTYTPATKNCNNTTTSYPSQCADNPQAAVYKDKIRRYPDYVNTDDFIGNVLSTNPVSQSNSNAAAIVQECGASCEAQADNWMAALAKCQADEVKMAQLRTALIEICQRGCVLSNGSKGASTLPAGSTPYASFEEAIAGILGANAISDSCTAELINMPYPYNKQPFDGNRVVYRADYDICSKVGQYKAQYAAAGFSGSFHQYLQQLLKVDYQLDSVELDNLIKSCTDCNGILKEPLVLPIAFEPAGRPCLDCNSVQQLLSAFNTKYNITVANPRYETLLTNYFNHSLGFSLTYADYKDFLDSCAAHPSGYAGRLCDQPVSPEVEDGGAEGNPCTADLFNTALENAYMEYNRYIDSVHIAFREAYMTKCLNVQANLKMKADLYEYHYTLYYYDQSGNLVKTIPPEGVTLLGQPQIDSVQLYRKLFSEGCYQYSNYLKFNPSTATPSAMEVSPGNYFTGTDPINPYSSTIELWVKPASAGNQGLFGHIWHHEDVDTVYEGASLSLVNKKLHFYNYKKYSFPSMSYLDTSEIRLESLDLTGRLRINEWNHVAITSRREGYRSVRIFLNGQEVTGTYLQDTLAETLPTGVGMSTFQVGRAYSWNSVDSILLPIAIDASNLSIKQLRVYEGMLTPSQIMQNAFSNCLLPVSEGGLRAWLPLNELVPKDLASPNTYFNLSGDIVGGSDIYPIYPHHRLPTTYVYNSLNQVIRQSSPDGGESQFWYDRLGRLTASQNAEQKDPSNNEPANRYSYTKYDGLGRITEVGEKTGVLSDLTHDVAKNNGQLSGWLTDPATANRQVTKTLYDNPVNLSFQTMANSRKRVVASVYLENEGDAEGDSTLYAYDLSGNVKTLVQHVKALVAADPDNGKKRMDYEYDLVSGKVNKVAYQKGRGDQFYYQYGYDAENRVVSAQTSRDGLVWTEDARYRYYLHGPLARTELGHYKVQGTDYAYTLQGWLKGINSDALASGTEMGGDGEPMTIFSKVSKDVYAFKLGYFGSDYQPIGGTSAPAFGQMGYTAPGTLENTGNPLYNGNIFYTTLALSKINNGATVGYTYGYDQLNRLREMRHHNVSAAWSNNSIISAYSESIAYDANGNISKYLRKSANTAGHPLDMDSLTYKYNWNNEGRLVNNRLDHVRDAVGNSNYTVDTDNQAAGNYSYDRIGNLVKDAAENIGNINWTLYGKIKAITKTGNAASQISYSYDPNGNRTLKTVEANETVKKTFYVRDAEGNVMGIYSQKNSGEVKWEEQHVYGSSRLGIWHWDTLVPVLAPIVQNGGNPIFDSLLMGGRTYELGNHLGNVLVTVSDKKIGHDGGNGTVDRYNADVTSAQDFYPFGMKMPDRQWSSGNYRFGFNGKENDDEVKGNGGQINYDSRVYDPKIATWLSTDPVNKPFISPYNFAGNNPINYIDPDGEDEIHFYYVTQKLRNPPRGLLYRSDLQPKLTFKIIKKDGPDKFFYHQVEKSLWTAKVRVNPKNIFDTRYKTLTVEISSTDKTTEFFPNAKMGEQGGPLRGTGITQSQGALPFMSRNDEDYTSLAKLASPALVKYLEAKDSKQYGGLATHQAFMKLGEGIQKAIGISLMIEGVVSAASIGRGLSQTEQRMTQMWSGGDFVTEEIAGFDLLASTVQKSGGVYQKNIVGLFSNKRQNVFSLMRAIEEEAIKTGASKVEINGLLIQNEKLFNEAAIKRLGYSFEKLDDKTISISKTLKSP